MITPETPTPGSLPPITEADIAAELSNNVTPGSTPEKASDTAILIDTEHHFLACELELLGQLAPELPGYRSYHENGFESRMDAFLMTTFPLIASL